MRGIAATFVVATSAVLLASCSSAAGTGTSSSSSSQPASTQPAASSPASATPGQSAAATSLDPCSLVTSSEASSLAGTTYGSGKEETSSGGGKICVYGYQTTNVFTVQVAQAKDPATAQADWSKEQGRAQALLKQKLPAGINVTLNTSNVANLGDRAANVTATAGISGQTLNISGIYVLKGATFFAFEDLVLNKAAPSSADMQSEAQTVLGRLP